MTPCLVLKGKKPGRIKGQGGAPGRKATCPRRREPQAERPQLRLQDILSPAWPQRLCLSLGLQPSCWGGLAHRGHISPICPGAGSRRFLSACVWYITVCKVLVTKIVSLNLQEPWVAGQGHDSGMQGSNPQESYSECMCLPQAQHRSPGDNFPGCVCPHL